MTSKHKHKKHRRKHRNERLAESSHEGNFNSIFGHNQIEQLSIIKGNDTRYENDILPKNQKSAINIGSFSNSERKSENILHKKINNAANDIIYSGAKLGDREKKFIKKKDFIFSRKRNLRDDGTSSSKKNARSSGTSKGNKSKLNTDTELINKILPSIDNKKSKTKLRGESTVMRQINTPIQLSAFMPPVLVRGEKPKHDVRKEYEENNINDKINMVYEHKLKNVLRSTKERRNENLDKVEKIKKSLESRINNDKENHHHKKDTSIRNDPSHMERLSKRLKEIKKYGRSLDDKIESDVIKSKKNMKDKYRIIKQKMIERERILSLNRLHRHDISSYDNRNKENDQDYNTKGFHIKSNLSNRWTSMLRNETDVSSIDTRFYSKPLHMKSDAELTWEEYKKRYPSKKEIEISKMKDKKIPHSKKRSKKIDQVALQYASSNNSLTLEEAHKELVSSLAVISASRIYAMKITGFELKGIEDNNMYKSMDIVENYSMMHGSLLSRKNRPMWKSSPSLFNQTTPVLYEAKCLREHVIMLGWRSAILAIRKSIQISKQCYDIRWIISRSYRNTNEVRNNGKSTDDVKESISLLLYALMIFENIIPSQMDNIAGSIKRFGATTSSSVMPEMRIEVVIAFAKICTVMIHNLIEAKVASPFIQESDKKELSNWGNKELDLKWLNTLQEKERKYMIEESSSSERNKGGVFEEFGRWLYKNDSEEDQLDYSSIMGWHAPDNDNISDAKRSGLSEGSKEYNRIVSTILREKKICYRGMKYMINSKFSNILRLSRAFVCMQCMDINIALDAHCWRSSSVNILREFESHSTGIMLLDTVNKIKEKNGGLINENLNSKINNVTSEPSFCASEPHKVMKEFMFKTTPNVDIIADIYREFYPSLCLKNFIYGLYLQNECLIALSLVSKLTSISNNNDDGDVNALEKSHIVDSSRIDVNEIQYSIEILGKISPLIEHMLIPMYGRRSIAIEMICWIMNHVEQMSNLSNAYDQIKNAAFHEDDNLNSSSDSENSSDDSSSPLSTSSDDDIGFLGKFGGSAVSKISGVKNYKEKKKLILQECEERITEHILYTGSTLSNIRKLLGFPKSEISKYSREVYRSMPNSKRMRINEDTVRPSDFMSNTENIFKKMGFARKTRIDRDSIERRDADLIENRIRLNSKLINGLRKNNGEINLEDLKKIDNVELAYDPMNKIVSREYISKQRQDIVEETLQNKFTNAFKDLKGAIWGRSETNTSELKNESSMDSIINSNNNRRVEQTKFFELDTDYDHSTGKKIKPVYDNRIHEENISLPEENNRLIPLSESDIKSWEYIIGMNNVAIEDSSDFNDDEQYIDRFFEEKSEIIDAYTDKKNEDVPIFSIYSSDCKTLMGKDLSMEYYDNLSNLSSEINNLTFYILKEKGYFETNK